MAGAGLLVCRAVHWHVAARGASGGHIPRVCTAPRDQRPRLALPSPGPSCAPAPPPPCPSARPPPPSRGPCSCLCLSAGFTHSPPDPTTLDFYLALNNLLPLPLPLKAVVLVLADDKVRGVGGESRGVGAGGMWAPNKGDVRCKDLCADGQACACVRACVSDRVRMCVCVWQEASKQRPVPCRCRADSALMPLPPPFARCLPSCAQGEFCVQLLPRELAAPDPPSPPLPPSVASGLETATHSFHQLHLNGHLQPHGRCARSYAA